MENQHRKISGYRELTQEEVDLMNRIKAAGTNLLQLHAELCGRLDTDRETLREADGLAAEGVRMRFIGGRERLDPKLQALMAGIEARTAG